LSTIALGSAVKMSLTIGLPMTGAGVATTGVTAATAALPPLEPPPHPARPASAIDAIDAHARVSSFVVVVFMKVSAKYAVRCRVEARYVNRHRLHALIKFACAPMSNSVCTAQKKAAHEGRLQRRLL